MLKIAFLLEGVGKKRGNYILANGLLNKYFLPAKGKAALRLQWWVRLSKLSSAEGLHTVCLNSTRHIVSVRAATFLLLLSIARWDH